MKLSRVVCLWVSEYVRACIGLLHVMYMESQKRTNPVIMDTHKWMMDIHDQLWISVIASMYVIGLQFGYP